MFALAGKLGKQTAHELVYNIAMHGLSEGMTFQRALMENSQVRAALPAEELNSLLDPTTYIGLAPEIVDRVLNEVRASGWLNSSQQLARLAG
jgi:adenylosuccinate lyase